MAKAKNTLRISMPKRVPHNLISAGFAEYEFTQELQSQEQFMKERLRIYKTRKTKVLYPQPDLVSIPKPFDINELESLESTDSFADFLDMENYKTKGYNTIHRNGAIALSA